MITLLGALLGFITSLAPDIFKFIKSKQDNAHELAMLGMNMELQKTGAAQRLEEIVVQAQSAENIAVHQYSPPVIGIGWVDALSASVRPIITYAFFIAYCLVKIAQYKMLAHVDALPWLTTAQSAQQWFSIINQLWSEEDGALFASVVCFWFGSRSATNGRGKK